MVKACHISELELDKAQRVFSNLQKNAEETPYNTTNMRITLSLRVLKTIDRFITRCVCDNNCEDCRFTNITNG